MLRARRGRFSQQLSQCRVRFRSRGVPFAADDRIRRRRTRKAAGEPSLARLRFFAWLPAARTYRVGEGERPSSNLLVWRPRLLPGALERRRIRTLLDPNADRAALELRVRNATSRTNQRQPDRRNLTWIIVNVDPAPPGLRPLSQADIDNVDKAGEKSSRIRVGSRTSPPRDTSFEVHGAQP
jgi:hypothetical protein